MRHTRRTAGTFFGLVLTMVAAGSSQAEGRKPDTPEDAYELRVGCAGIAAATVAQSGMAHSGSDKERAHAEKLMSETRGEALASGDRIGRSAAQVSEAIDRSRDGILERFAKVANDPAALAKEKADLGRVVIDCALVEVMERRDARQATPVPESKPPR